MAWRHYQRQISIELKLVQSGASTSATLEMGIIETGRSRVFSGYYISLYVKDRELILEEDEHSLRSALWRLARKIEQFGLALNCVGLDAEFSESGLSYNTGWGYFGPEQQPMHMIDRCPLGKGGTT